MDQARKKDYTQKTRDKNTSRRKQNEKKKNNKSFLKEKACEVTPTNTQEETANNERTMLMDKNKRLKTVAKLEKAQKQTAEEKERNDQLIECTIDDDGMRNIREEEIMLCVKVKWKQITATIYIIRCRLHTKAIKCDMQRSSDRDNK